MLPHLSLFTEKHLENNLWKWTIVLTDFIIFFYKDGYYSILNIFFNIIMLVKIPYTQGSNLFSQGMRQLLNSPLTLKYISYSGLHYLDFSTKIWRKVKTVSEIYLLQEIKVNHSSINLNYVTAKGYDLQPKSFFRINFKTQPHFTILCVQSKPIFLYLYSHNHFAYNLLFCLQSHIYFCL